MFLCMERLFTNTYIVYLATIYSFPFILTIRVNSFTSDKIKILKILKSIYKKLYSWETWRQFKKLLEPREEYLHNFTVCGQFLSRVCGSGDIALRLHHQGSGGIENSPEAGVVTDRLVRAEIVSQIKFLLMNKLNYFG